MGKRAMTLYTKQTEGTKLKVADISDYGLDQEKASEQENNQNRNGWSKKMGASHDWGGLAKMGEDVAGMEENDSELCNVLANAAILDDSSRTPFLGPANISSSLVDEFGKAEVELPVQPVDVQESDSDSNWAVSVWEEDEEAEVAKDGDVCDSRVEPVFEPPMDYTMECKVNMRQIPQNTH